VVIRLQLCQHLQQTLATPDTLVKRMHTTRLCIALLDAHKERVRIEVTRDFQWHTAARPIQNSMKAAPAPKYFNANSVVVATLLTQQHEHRTMHITGHSSHQLIITQHPPAKGFW